MKTLKTLGFPIGFIIVALFAKMFVLNSHTNEVDFFKSVEHPGYESSPAFYNVYPSPAKAWDLQESTKGGRTANSAAFVFFWLAMAFVVIAQLPVLPLKTWHIIVGEFILLALWLSLKYSDYSGIISNTYKQLSEQQLNEAKSQAGGLDALFDGVKPVK